MVLYFCLGELKKCIFFILGFPCSLKNKCLIRCSFIDSGFCFLVHLEFSFTGVFKHSSIFFVTFWAHLNSLLVPFGVNYGVSYFFLRFFWYVTYIVFSIDCIVLFDFREQVNGFMCWENSSSLVTIKVYD